MRRQALRASSSTHNVCVFCATRLNNANFLDAALHPLPLPASSSSSPFAPAAARNLLHQRRAISSSRPSQNFGSGAAAQQQQQQRNDVDPEPDAARNRFNAAPTVPPMKQQMLLRQQQQQQKRDDVGAGPDAVRKQFNAAPAIPPMKQQMLLRRQQQQQQPQQPQSAAIHPEAAALNALFSQEAPAPSPQQQQQQRSGGVVKRMSIPKYQAQVEKARQLREREREEDVRGFDMSKASGWTHMQSKSRDNGLDQRRQETQQQYPQRVNIVRRTSGRPDGDKRFVPLNQGQDQEKLLGRFNRFGGSGGGGGAAQEQQAGPQGFTRSAQAQPVRPPSTRGSEKDLINTMFAPAAPEPKSFSFQDRSQPRANPRSSFERDYRMAQLPRSPAQPPPSVERDPSMAQVARSPAERPPAPSEEFEAKPPQKTEMQPQESEQTYTALQQVRERERAARFSRFAAAEEEEAPRKRKAKGGRNFSVHEEDEVDISRLERKSKKKEKKRQLATEMAPPTPIYLPEYLSVANLANLLKVRTESLVNKMMELGFEDIMNDDILNAENAGLIAMEYNFEPVAADPSDDLDLYPAPEPEDKAILPPRPPVVTIMGHVDHGKTTLLDYLRKSSVAATEFGGITQHIGAFSVPLSNDKTITFLDTPGHAAFLSMRQRGANVTDIVILVVAADDSVKPQTIEAIKHAKSARVPIIVAINKIDKEGANPEQVKQDLARHGVDVEDFGGDIQAIPVSGKTGQGMQDLEEAAITLSEILDHRADPEGPVEGWVLEVSTKKSGKAATVLVRRGTLKVGSIIVAGQTFARVRSIRNEAGVEIPTVGPGMPAEIDGWRGQPSAGDEVLEAPNERRAAEVVEYRETNAERIQMAKDMEAINEARRLEHEKREREREREQAIAAAAEAGAEDPEAAVAAAEQQELESAKLGGGPKVIPFVVKADVSGSVEAVVDYVMTVGNGEVQPRVLRTGVGAVSESDVDLAATAGGHVVVFNTAVDQRMASMAEAKGVRLLEQNVIYRLVDDVKALLSEHLAPAVTHRVTGEANVLEVFEIKVARKKTSNIAGCRVTNGVVNARSKVRVFRKDEKIYDGKISSLKQVKKDITEMQKGNECGMAFENWGEFKAGDTIQCYEEKFEKRFL
ncbi:initiation factor 2 [Diplodia corticola]|uniref:Translation initiation factor IF-2, mitochondrial n=1 Tax=Diplodia corticola TaxID=236234 RepID=A0A1J9R276_9PEZI|nr:initiation factor 2 [Diplodia corticola]OJD34689.1 initiation factor 2 [Diplodia corticola]